MRIMTMWKLLSNMRLFERACLGRNIILCQLLKKSMLKIFMLSKKLVETRLSFDLNKNS